MYKKHLLLAAAVVLFSGCASVPMESKLLSDKAKEFNSPSKGSSGLYIYRTTGVGGALKKDVKVNGKCIGETAPSMFFYEEVAGDKQHSLMTESEFSPNELLISVESGKNYFIEQFIKMGVFVGGADFKVASLEEGKADVSRLGMAVKGTCSD